MRHNKYGPDNKAYLGCHDFSPNGSACCSSCHEDYEYDSIYDLCEADHPLNPNITAMICCGIVNTYFYEDEPADSQGNLDSWEKALARYEEGIDA